MASEKDGPDVDKLGAKQNTTMKKRTHNKNRNLEYQIFEWKRSGDYNGTKRKENRYLCAVADTKKKGIGIKVYR